MATNPEISGAYETIMTIENAKLLAGVPIRRI